MTRLRMCLRRNHGAFPSAFASISAYHNTIRPLCRTLEKHCRWFAASQSSNSSSIPRQVAPRRVAPFQVERFHGWDKVDPSRSLSSSECEPLRLDELLEMASPREKSSWNALSLGYANQAGSLELRDMIARRLGQGCSGLHDVTVAAPQEAITLAMIAILEKGDRVVVSTPCYQSLHSVASALEANVIDWPARFGPASQGNSTIKKWHFDVEELEKLFDQGPVKALVANFPHNPTGFIPRHEEFLAIAALCERHGAWFFCDEMYRGLEHGSRLPLPHATNLLEKGISMGGLSKTFGLPGLRVGWLVSRNKAFTERVRELKDYTTICTASPSEALALIALQHADQVEGRCKNTVAKGLSDLRAFVKKWDHLLDWCEPQGGTFGMIRLRQGLASAYCDELIEKHDIMLLPTKLFGFDDDDHVRVCYGTGEIEHRLALWEATPLFQVPQNSQVDSNMKITF